MPTVVVLIIGGGEGVLQTVVVVGERGRGGEEREGDGGSVVEVRLGWVRETREGGGWGGGDGLTVVARWVKERRVRWW